MRICLVCQDYPAPGVAFGGGLGSGIYLLAHALTRQGHTVHVITNGARGTTERRWCDGAVHLHVIKHRRVPLPGVRYAAFLAFYSRRVAQKIREIAGQEGLDVVEAPEFGAEGWWYGFRPDLPLLVRVHTPLPLLVELSNLRRSRDYRLVCWMERSSILRACHRTTTSRYVAEQCERFHRIPATHLEVVPPGINVAHFRFTVSDWRMRLGLQERLLVLYAGRLEWRKGVQTLIAGWPAVLDWHPHAHLLLVGGDSPSGPGGLSMRAYLEQQIMAQGTGQHITFLGQMNYHTMPEIYSAADVIAAPSHAEPFGLVYLEAMGCARPTIGCTVGGAAEIIHTLHDGVLVPPNDPAALSAALILLLGDAALRRRLGDAGRVTVEHRYSAEVFARASVAAYEHTIQLHGQMYI